MRKSEVRQFDLHSLPLKFAAINIKLAELVIRPQGHPKIGI